MAGFYWIVIFCFVFGMCWRMGYSEVIKPNLCGDWIPYKDEKCVKITDQAGAQNQEDAENVCRKLSKNSQNYSMPQLLTIKSVEEQEFMHNFLFVENEMVDSVWLGLRKDGSDGKFEWNDDSDLHFHNWAAQALKDEQNQCVEMESGDGVIAAGLWLRVSCKRKNAIVCEKRPIWTLESMQNSFLNFKFEQEIKQKAMKEEFETKYTKSQMNIIELEKINAALEQRIRTSEKAIIVQQNKVAVPVGFIYVQLPKQDSPQLLWPSANWADVSSEYAGLFFRVVGGEAAPFGEIQEGNSTIMDQIQYSQDYAISNFITIPSNGTWSPYVKSGTYYNGHNNNLESLQFRMSASEVRPRNQAVKIWKRL